MTEGGRESMYAFRNAATETVKQELLFVGQESGKLIAISDIIAKACIQFYLCFSFSSI